MIKQKTDPRHSVTDIKLHICFATKRRRLLFYNESEAFILRVKMNEFQDLWNSTNTDFVILKNGNGKDHFHFLIEVDASVNIPNKIGCLKTVLLRYLRNNIYPNTDLLTGCFFQRGYYCTSVGNVSTKRIEKYIENNV